MNYIACACVRACVRASANHLDGGGKGGGSRRRGKASDQRQQHEASHHLQLGGTRLRGERKAKGTHTPATNARTDPLGPRTTRARKRARSRSQRGTTKPISACMRCHARNDTPAPWMIRQPPWRAWMIRRLQVALCLDDQTPHGALVPRAGAVARGYAAPPTRRVSYAARTQRSAPAGGAARIAALRSPCACA